MPEDKDEENYVLCARRDDLNSWVEGAIEGNCCECDEIVMVSPSTFPLLRDENAKLICMHCVLKYEKFLTQGVRQLNPEQIKEIINELKKGK